MFLTFLTKVAKPTTSLNQLVSFSTTFNYRQSSSSSSSSNNRYNFKMEEVKLVKATWEQFKKSTYDNYEAWGSKLTVEQYWNREADSKEFAQNHRPWVLLNKDEEIVASCETYEYDSFYCNLESDQPDIQYATSQGIASVFVEQKYRGKGYAASLMKHLNAQVKNEGSMMTDLYSDIEPKVYEKCGWHIHPANTFIIDSEITMKIDSDITYKPVTIDTIDTVSDWIIKNNDLYIKEKWFETKSEQQQQQQNDTTSSTSSSASPIKYIYGKLMKKNHIMWHIKQVQTYANALDTKPYPETFGCVANQPGNGGYIIWSHDIRDDCLNILSVAADNQVVFYTLLEKALEEARTYKFKHVMFWVNDWSKFRSEWLTNIGIEISVREGSVPMVCSFVKQGDQEKVDTSSSGKWINIEKFGWI
ncbi:hypothetical protein DFA_09510 [Cavenderia fasciculata]|uniref:N-acetyltransferase domain-containing protein n=1 Tax=Cavenderia fasciculata TaxID=261658 RepID=F4Q7U1_CACFS|nr:uncharacterized protein DFA_09510 [Cavenderia fasciculata]EGG15841.1 hypothetical protein DFA_09510 [Cavenderia fasciculata]|eukprot:XP_004352166.1 hypothetical protein DFA_09510 [Cavenderia fasciculata]